MQSRIHDYRAFLAARFYSRGYCGQVQRYLEILVQFLKARYALTDWSAVSEPHLMAFSAWAAYDYRDRKGTPLTPRSLATWFSAIRPFFSFLHAQGDLLHNPASGLPTLKIGLSLPPILTEAAMACLIETPDLTTPTGLRDRAVMELLYATGLRRSEVAQLDLGHLDLAAQQVFVREGKGRKDRVVPLTPQSCHWLLRYVAEARPQLVLGASVISSAFFVGRYGKRLTGSRVAKFIGDYARKAGVSATPHTFRHTIATHLIRRGASIRMVQKLLGHVHLDTTQRYTHLTVLDVKAAIEKARFTETSSIEP